MAAKKAEYVYEHGNERVDLAVEVCSSFYSQYWKFCTWRLGTRLVNYIES